MTRLDRVRLVVAAIVVVLAPGLGCAASGRPLAMLSWADGIDPELLAGFERQTGTPVSVDSYVGTDALIDALHTGRYDVVILSADALPALNKAGLLSPLTARYPAVVGDLVDHLAAVDAGGPHAVPFAWFGTTLVARADKLQDRHVAIASLEGWGTLLKPDVLRRIVDCGTAAPVDGRDLYAAAVSAVARDPGAPDSAEVRRAESLVAAVRPLVRRLAETELVDGLATGELCLGLVSEAAAWQVNDRVTATSTPVPTVVVPRPGGRLFLDVLAVSAHAPNPAAAMQLVGFLLQPESAARNAIFAHAHSAVLALDAAPATVAAERSARVGLMLLPDDDPVVQNAAGARPRTRP